MGSDLSGVVVEVGASVRRFKPGDEVYARVDEDRFDYKTHDYAAELHDYDLVFDTLGGKVPERSLAVLKPGGKLISIADPPDAEFAREMGLGWAMQQVMRLLSYRVRKHARRLGVSYSFLFMKPSGEQPCTIGALIDSGALRPVLDRVFAFDSTLEALAYVERGRAKGKVVVTVK